MIELLISQHSTDIEKKFQFHKVNTGYSKPLKGRKAAKHLFMFGYQLMKDAWSGPVRTEAVDAAEDAVLEGRSKSPVLDFFFPVREFDGLISYAEGETRRFYPFVEYKSPGGFPRITYRTFLNVLIREAINPLQYMLTRTRSFGLGSDQLWHLWYLQRRLKKYEEALDSKMVGAFRKKTKDKIPLSVREYEIAFCYAFKESIDKLGGIDRFVQIREDLYKTYENLDDSGYFSGPVKATLYHFRNVCEKKVGLYHRVGKMDVDAELATARKDSFSNPVIARCNPTTVHHNPVPANFVPALRFKHYCLCSSDS